MTSHLRYASPTVLAAAFVLAGSFAQVSPAYAASTCTFATDLTIGTVSDSVKCLQQYLNANGFTVSDSGVGSVGHETTQFQAKTLAAVKAWQTANGVTPVTGTFGPKSRAKYVELTTAATTPPPTTSTTTTSTTPPPTTDNAAMLNARKIIDKVRDTYENTQNDYGDAHDNGDSTGSAKTDLAEAEDKLMSALYAYVDGDYSEAIDDANDAQDLINSAADQLDGKSGNGDQSDARNAIKNAKGDLNDARNKVADADDRGKSVSRAESYLEDADDSLQDAQDSYDEEDYNDALSSVDDAEKSIDKALDAI